ncbi:MAG: MoaD/ThiS family protein, partial [Candidatus Odinarchaeota archaeon]
EKEQFELSSDTLKELLNILFKNEKLKNLIWDKKNQQIHNLISIIINNQPIHEKNPSLVKLHNNDRIAFLLPVSGG